MWFVSAVHVTLGMLVRLWSCSCVISVLMFRAGYTRMRPCNVLLSRISLDACEDALPSVGRSLAEERQVGQADNSGVAKRE